MKHSPEAHVADDQLIELLVLADGDEADERRTALASHVVTCAECSVRHAALVAWLDAQADAAELEADSVFTLDRLSRQRRAIMARLEGRRAATIIPFPAAAASVPGTRHTTKRWVSMAAAAGLVFGLLAGRAIDRFDFRPSSGSVRPTRIVAATPPPARVEPAEAGFEETLLDEVDAALAGPVIAELHAIDAMTSIAVDASFPQQ